MIKISFATLLCMSLFINLHAETPSPKPQFDVQGAEFMVPKTVSLSLFRLIEGGKRIPVVFLSAMAGDSCDSVSELKTRRTVEGNKLAVDIEGYYLKKGEEGDCADAILQSRSRIEIHDEWLKKKGDKEILIRMNGQENRYKLSYDPGLLKTTLTGLQTPNVLIYGSSSESAAAPLEITLYPLDVAVMHVKGMTIFNQVTPITGDHRPPLKKFAQTKGFVPADQIYPEIRQDEQNCLKVVKKDRSLPEGPDAESLGEFPNELGAQIVLEKIPIYEEDYHCR